MKIEISILVKNSDELVTLQRKISITFHFKL